MTTLKQWVAGTLACLLPTGVLGDPPGDVVAAIDIPAALVCDTKEQIADIALAAIAGGIDGALIAFRPYAMARNDRGEPLCVIGRMRGRFAFGESVFVGEGMVRDAVRHFWATHIGLPTGLDYWMLWDEPQPAEPASTGWDV